MFPVPDPGAAHLYLLDFVPNNLPELKETIQKKYPDVKVRFTRLSPENLVDILRSLPCKPMLRTKPPSLPFVNRR